MDLFPVEYKIKTAGAESVYLHLYECKDDFDPSLDVTVDIAEYSRKIVENSITFEAWAGNDLIGLIAAYFNEIKNHSGFITDVSVLKGYSGKGIASELLSTCINYAMENEFKEISLEVSLRNERAIRLYMKHDFYQTAVKGDLVIMKRNIFANNGLI